MVRNLEEGAREDEKEDEDGNSNGNGKIQWPGTWPTIHGGIVSTYQKPASHTVTNRDSSRSLDCATQQQANKE